MKSQIVKIGLVFFILLSCASAVRVVISPRFKTTRAKIAILPFSNIGKEGFDFNESDKFATYCMEMGFIVVERTKLQQVMKELDLQYSMGLEKKEINKIGKILGVDMLVFGQREYRNISSGCLGSGGDTLKLISQTIRFVDVATGEVMISAISENEPDPYKVTKQMAQSIRNKILLLIDLREGNF